MKHNLIDPHITTSIGANIIHLLFVKYDKDPDIAFKILLECVRLGVDVNLVDELDAAPIHVALRKRQYQVINDCIRINMQREEPLFNLNLLDKKGMTGLHYAVDKQDHDMFLALIQSSNLDIFQVDFLYQRAIHNTVIFSSFHKILYKREKLRALKLFQKELISNFISFS
jgi:ankyrin repeat protein